ncbi:hypothetical protein PoB_007078500 [Plakobranchus ocellatus]|uniref:Transcriptional regulatory protein RXT2 N-terminal domain-containing protein n=1 Tax=Plakobranchus ocellatus TaxID=259542 RepID=A0AAV4DJU0_9GAST|nr:hypothetical protein PoB_007078500 [Plakobranchus ocellatus]
MTIIYGKRKKRAQPYCGDDNKSRNDSFGDEADEDHDDDNDDDDDHEEEEEEEKEEKEEDVFNGVKLARLLPPLTHQGLCRTAGRHDKSPGAGRATVF